MLVTPKSVTVRTFGAGTIFANYDGVKQDTEAGLAEWCEPVLSNVFRFTGHHRRRCLHGSWNRGSKRC
jgi:hypothetical protein